MHRADAEYLIKGINHIGTPTSLSGHIIKSLFIRTDRSVSKALKVDIVLEGDEDLHEFGVSGRVIHTPGHTEGSISLILSDGKAIVGDLMMGGILFKKVPHYPLFANDISRLRESIRKIIQLSPKVIYASHGGPFSNLVVEKFYLNTLRFEDLLSTYKLLDVALGSVTSLKRSGFCNKTLASKSFNSTRNGARRPWYSTGNPTCKNLMLHLLRSL